MSAGGRTALRRSAVIWHMARSSFRDVSVISPGALLYRERRRHNDTNHTTTCCGESRHRGPVEVQWGSSGRVHLLAVAGALAMTGTCRLAMTGTWRRSRQIGSPTTIPLHACHGTCGCPEDVDGHG